jgi:Tol biopolymer transport system component
MSHLPVLVRVAVLGLPLVVACTTYDPLYCDEDRSCKDPARPFCDLAGEYPASDGVARTCIPSPFDAGGEDGGGTTIDAGPDGGPATDAPASCTDRLALATTRDGNVEIYLSDPDGSNQINLTQNPAGDSQPAWSPDGSRIAFVRDSAIWAMNADGSEPIELTAGEGDDTLYSPAWSPDGTRVAFIRFAVGSGFGLWAVNASGGEPVNLAPASGPGVSWSPDGTQIAFEGPSGGNADIFTINGDGTQRTNRSNAPGGDRVPTWSPDGEEIVFTSERTGNSEVWIMTADGNKPRNLTNSKELDGSGIFLPDGSKIIFTRSGELFSMNADGTGQQQITSPGESIDSDAEISPDGQRIAWTRSRIVDNQLIAEVFVAGVDGSGPIRLTPEGGGSATWRPCR